MAEGLTHDIFDDDDFDRVEERVVPIRSLPIPYNGMNFMLTPANAAIRLFFGEDEEYNRVVVYPGDGSTASVKLDDDAMRAMVHGGFPIELPARPDETDREFMEGYIQQGIDDIFSEAA